MKTMKKIATKLTALKEKFSQTLGKGNLKSETRTYNHPRKDKTVRDGKN